MIADKPKSSALSLCISYKLYFTLCYILTYFGFSMRFSEFYSSLKMLNTFIMIYFSELAIL